MSSVIICPNCGSECEWVKLYPSKNYSGCIVCENCGRRSHLYTSKQAAIKGWNSRTKYSVDIKGDGEE